MHQIRYPPVSDLIHPPASKQSPSFPWEKFFRKFMVFSLLMRTLIVASFMLLWSMPNRQPVASSKSSKTKS